MSKSRFLELLSEKLSEVLSRSEVISHIQYYESYIDGEVAKGRSLEAVMDELGDPYLIARTILDTNVGTSYTDGKYTEESVESESGQQTVRSSAGRNGNCLIAAAVMFLVLAILMFFVGSILRILLPILIPVLLVVFVFTILKSNK